MYLRATDIKRGLKATFPQYTFKVQRHGKGWRMSVSGATEADMPSIKDRFRHIIDHPDEFVAWQPISATTGEFRVIRPE